MPGALRGSPAFFLDCARRRGTMADMSEPLCPIAYSRTREPAVYIMYSPASWRARVAKLQFLRYDLAHARGLGVRLAAGGPQVYRTGPVAGAAALLRHRFWRVRFAVNTARCNWRLRKGLGPEARRAARVRPPGGTFGNVSHVARNPRYVCQRQVSRPAIRFMAARNWLLYWQTTARKFWAPRIAASIRQPVRTRSLCREHAWWLRVVRNAQRKEPQCPSPK